MRDCEINGTKSCPVMLTLVTVKFFVCIGLHEGLNAILCLNKSLAMPLLLLSSFPPTAYYDGARITNVPQDEHTRLLKSHMHLTQYVDQVCIICGSVKVTLCPLTSSADGVRTCTTPSTHISVDLVIVL